MSKSLHTKGRNWNAEARHKLTKGEIKGNFAGPDESFPIAGPGDVTNAWRLAGHAANPEAVRRKIIAIAKAHGWESALPKSEKMSLSAPVHLLSQNLVRVPLALKGSWYHDDYGVVQFDDEKFDRLIENYRDDVLGFKPYATYGHLMDQNVTAAAWDAERKKGDLLDLDVEDDVLFGHFQVNDETYDLLQRGEYEYSSPEIIQDFIDKDTGLNRGAVLVRTALTNAPFIPFRDSKIEVLSQSRPQEHLSFAIRLQHDEPLLPNMPNSEIPLVPIETEAVTVPQAEEFAQVQPEPARAVVAPEVTPAPISPAILEQLAQLQAVVTQLQTETAQTKTENSALRTELAETRQIAQQFSTHVGREQEGALLNSLANAGVPPVYVQRFSQVRRALLNTNAASQTIKLSVRGQETNRALVDEVAALLVDAFNANEDARVITEPVGAPQYIQAGDINERLSLMAKQILAAAHK